MGVYKRPDSPFYWYRIECTRHRLSTGIPVDAGSPEQAREQRRQAEAIYAAAKTTHATTRAGLTTAPLPAMPFATFAVWYEQHHIAHQRGVDKGRSMLRKLRLYFDRFTLPDITDPVVREWMSWRKKQVQPSTVNRELDVLKALLRASVPLYIPSYPLGDVRRFRLPEREARVLTDEEEARLLSACGPFDRAFILAGLDTLLRLGSLLALQWPQVQIERRVIVPLNAKVSLDAVPISTRLLQALKALPRTSAYVFPHFHANQRPTSAKNRAMRRFHALCALADVPHGRAIGGVTIHCLRHTGATRALQRGASVRTIMKLGGWRCERTVMRYLHASDLDVRAAAESIAGPRRVKTR